MSQKQRLQALLEKFQKWSKHDGDELLDEHIATLSTEIQLMDETDQSDGDGGNSPLHKPKVP